MNVNQPNLSITVVGGEFDVASNKIRNDNNLDACVVVTLGAHKYATQVAQDQGRSLEWNEIFNYYYSGTKEDIITLDVWDKYRSKDPIFIGTDQINVYEVENSCNWERSMEIKLQGNKVGSVQIVFDFVGKQPKKPTPKQQSQQIPIQQPEMKMIQLIRPQQAPRIQFQSCDYEGQIEEMNKKLKRMEDKSNSHQANVMNYLEKNVNNAIQEGLESLVKEKPHNQIQFLGQFLLNYKIK